MLLRVITGTVAAGRESDFVGVCRQQIADRGRSAGLVAFMAGYRRVAGLDRFLLAATWETEADAVRAAGDEANLTVAEVMAGVATIDTFDVYDVLEPAFRGIVDAPGGVVRVSHARVSAAAHVEMLKFMCNPPRDRAANIQRLMLGWAIGERRALDGDGYEAIAVSAWPSSLAIEAVSDGDGAAAPIYAGIDSFATDFEAEHFRAIGLELPESMSDVSSRRIIAARFETPEDAQQVARTLSAEIASARASNMSVAPLGAPGTASDVRSFILVARVAMNEYARAERLIVDEGGDVILSQMERADTEPDEYQLDPIASFEPASGLSPAR